MEKSDEFDECMFNRQKFPTKILHLEYFGIAYFTVMSGHGILEYFHPIIYKMYAPEDKDPPERKELSNLFGSYIYIYIKGYTIIIVINFQL